MKLVTQCSVAPSLVVEWLCGELEERGIPGPTYAHTLLSLLHHHYCPHPSPLTAKVTPTRTTPSLTPGLKPGHPGATAPQRYHHPLSRKHLDDFDLRDLNLDDLLASTTHPDADLPTLDIFSFTQQQRGSSRRARKRYKVRQKQRTLTSEQLQKVAALQCLMSASDERYDLECLVEELCSRLQSAKEEQNCSGDPANNRNFNSTTVDGGLLRGSEESQANDTTDDSADSYTPEEQAQKYYAAFPPLSGSHVDNCEPWKPDSAACSRALISKRVIAPFKIGDENLKHPVSDGKMPRSHRKKLREREKKKSQEDGNEAEGGSTRRSQHHVTFTFLGKNKEGKKLSTNHYDTDSASDIESGKERRRKKFTGPLPDEDIGEGYIGDTSSRESSEDRDKGELFCGIVKEDKCECNASILRGIGLMGSIKASPEEWECMSNLLLYGAGNDKLLEANIAGEHGHRSSHGGNSRLFERGSTSSTGGSGSSSDVETSMTGDLDAESVRLLEAKISHTMAAWGQAADDIGHGRGEHVWDPPTMNDLNLYTSIWGYDAPEGLQHHQQQNVIGREMEEQQESSISHNPIGITTQDALSSLTPTVVGEPPPSLWPQNSETWQSSLNPLINEDDDPLICSFHSHSSLNSSNNNLGLNEIILSQTDGIEKEIWSDCNANNISGQGDSIISFVEDIENANVDIFKQDNIMSKSSEDIESKLCESFKKLDLENLWDSSLGLANAFASDLSISNSNLESVCNNNNVISESTKSDPQHEQMMALVEDVCKSYEESQEEVLSDTQTLKQVANGPRGPHADLRHSEESSGFTVVKPRTPKCTSGLEELSDSLLLGGTADMSHLDAPGPLPEEENLLTSPRTHFRPIRQESLGSTADEHYEDGTMFVINSDPPDLPFQRTGSGNLFLESDILQGSPKKYMVYKEPVAKPLPNEDKDEEVEDKNDAASLVPKFKVVNNEKFCQTEDESSKKLRQLYSKSCREKLTSSYETNDVEDEFLILNSNEEESDVFDFQHQDFPEPPQTIANIWKTNEESDENSSDIMYSKNIWQMQLNHQDKVWSVLLENAGSGGGKTGGYELGASAVGCREDDVSTGGSGWSCEAQFEPIQEQGSSAVSSLLHNKSEAVSIPTSLSNLWESEISHSGNPLSSPMFGNSVSSLKSLWSRFPSMDREQESKGVKEVESTQISHQQQPPVGSQLSGIIQESCFVFSNLEEPDPWKNTGMTESFPTGLKKDTLWPDSGILEAPGRLFGITSDRCVGGSSFRGEIDKEAEELLGALSAAQTNTSSAAPQLYGNSLPSHGNPHPPLQHNRMPPSAEAAASTHGNSLPLGRLSPFTSPRPLHERLSKAGRGVSGTSGGGGGAGGVGVGETRGGMNGEVIEQEDLDDLAPGWELNDGFEWEPHASQDKDDEDGCADSGEGCEVLVYEADDGSTYTIPVEYLDDSLYDQIFGESTGNHGPLGGSLPDLPLGNPLHMRFSTELEEEWKKSGIPYKVQLPRKSRPGKWLPPSRRPCSFFMEGNCRRTDCKFSHDLASITCRFWEEGSCLKGITCPFLHGYPLRRRRNKSEGAAAAVSHTDIERVEKLGSSFEINSEMDFPSLGSSAESKVSTMEEHLGVSGSNIKIMSQGGSTATVTIAKASPAVAKHCPPQHKPKKKKKFITITKNLIGEIKSMESERSARRRAVKMRERRRRNTDTNSDAVIQKHPAQTGSQTKSSGLKKGDRQRTHGNGHDDGTMSDY